MADVTLPRYVVSGAVPRTPDAVTFEHVQREFERIQSAWAALAAAVEKSLGTAASVDLSAYVQGPTSAVADEVAVYDGTTGKLIKRASATGVAKLADGVLSAGDVDLAAEVTGDLPIAHLALDGVAANVLHGDGTLSPVAAGDVTGFAHDLLSVTHEDTETSTPAIGAIIVGGPDVVIKTETFWADGEGVDGVRSAVNVGAGAPWLDGHAADALGLTLSPTGAVWRKLTPDTAGSVPTYDGSQVVWAVPSLATAVFTATAVRATALAVPKDTATVVPWSSAVADTGPYWSSGTPSRLTIPVAGAGVYLAIVQITWAASALSGALTVSLRVNGTVVATTVAFTVSGVAQPQQTAHLRQLVAGDYLDVVVSDPSFARTVSGGATATWLSLAKVG